MQHPGHLFICCWQGMLCVVVKRRRSSVAHVRKGASGPTLCPPDTSRASIQQLAASSISSRGHTNFAGIVTSAPG